MIMMQTSDYTNLVKSLVDSALEQTEGVAKEIMIRDKKTSRKKDAHIIRIRIEEQYVSIDVSVSVIFGYSIPQVSCELQEKIIESVKENTTLTPTTVNVNVTNAIFL